MPTTTATRIILDCMLENNGFPEFLRKKTSDAGLKGHDALQYCERATKKVVEGSLEGSLMPDFAQEILTQALAESVDWQYIARRLLADPVAN
jgi:hypothetical protein